MTKDNKKQGDKPVMKEDIDRLDKRLDNMEKLDRKMYGSLKGIEQHLEDLNGKVAKNTKRTNQNRDWIKYGLGGVATFTFIAGTVIAVTSLVI